MVTISELDRIADAVWHWEEKRKKHTSEFFGRAAFEATMELQEWLLQKEREEKRK